MGRKKNNFFEKSRRKKKRSLLGNFQKRAGVSGKGGWGGVEGGIYSNRKGTGCWMG